MPEINQCHEMPITHGSLNLSLRKKIGTSLRTHKYDLSIVLPNSWKSALIPYFAKIPMRIGWKGEARYILLNHIKKLDKTNSPLMIQRYLALGINFKNLSFSDICKQKLLPSLTSSNTHKLETLKKLQYIKSNKKILTICPGAAFGPAKQWPAEYHAQIANTMLNNNWEIWLLGAGADMQIINKINTLTNNKCYVFGNTASLTNKIDLLKMSDIVVANDSGLLHITCAVNTPVIAIYGSTTPEFTPPLSDNNIILSIPTKNLSCKPCFKRTCKYKHYKCLQDIAPNTVLESIKKLQNNIKTTTHLNLKKNQ